MAQITSSQIIDLLIKERHPGSKWECIKELRLGCGYGDGRERSIDLWCIEATNSNNCRTTSYEVKISRSDFKADLKVKEKQRGALVFSNFFYYVAPIGIIKIEDVPPWAGLIEIEPDMGIFGVNEKRCKIKLKSYYRDKCAPTWSLVVSMLRRSKKIYEKPK
jgi:hypothetical protein